MRTLWRQIMRPMVIGLGVGSAIGWAIKPLPLKIAAGVILALGGFAFAWSLISLYRIRRVKQKLETLIREWERWQ